MQWYIGIGLIVRVRVMGQGQEDGFMGQEDGVNRCEKLSPRALRIEQG